MRLQLIAVAAAATALAPRAHADTTFEAKTQVYTDSDHTTVVSPAVDAHADVTPTTGVSLGYVVDVVSSASVDIVSQASKITIHDTRHEVSAGLSQIFGALALAGTYSFSRENDYQSNTAHASLSRDFDDKNTTLALGYGVSFNVVGRAGDENFQRDETTQHLALTWTQVISPLTISSVTYEYENDNGFQSSPYRFIPIRASVDAMPDYWVLETMPLARNRNAFVVGLNHALGDDAVQGDYRFYIDDWGIISHTVGARYFWRINKRTELRLRNRFYTQSAASFYQQVYTQPLQFMTYDGREMAAQWSETFGGKLVYRFTDHLQGELKCDVFYFSYTDFALQTRTGTNLGAGLSVTY
jgi:hypothetical protein